MAIIKNYNDDDYKVDKESRQNPQSRKKSVKGVPDFSEKLAEKT